MTAEEFTALIDGLRGLPYGGEAVDQRTHALQAAGHAIEAGADDELVIAAALHDIGRAAPVRSAHPGLPHEAAGAAFARLHLGERIAWVIEAHVPAKRYLVATDPTYRDQLSPVSIRSLAKQGGEFSPEQAHEFAVHPWAADATAVRRWDDAAKDPDAPGAEIDAVLAAFNRLPAAQ